MTIAVIRVRGSTKVRTTINDTLDMLNIPNVNNCTLIPETPTYNGMLQKTKDYVTWGTINKETFTKLLLKWGRTTQNQKVTEEYLKQNKTTITDLLEGKKKFKDANIKPTFRLHPPRKGYEGVKRPYSMKGALGNRKEKINELLERMI